MDTQKAQITKIFISDENILFRESLAALLNSQPEFKVVGEAGSVRLAIEKAIELKPDIILMDFLFSDGSGIDAIKPILSAVPEAKIIILTMYDSDDLLYSAINCGARGYLQKNIPSTALIASIHALLKGEAAISRAHVNRLLDEFSRMRSNSHAGDPVSSVLTKRELEVIKDLELGLSNREIAKHLSISENTVKRHIHSILKKLGLRSRREVATYAREQGL